MDTRKGRIGTAWIAACVVARSAGKNIGVRAAGVALAVLLGIAGCSESHSGGVSCPTRECAPPPGIDTRVPGRSGPDAGSVDQDGDGYPPPTDCDDSDARVHPGAPDESGYDCRIGRQLANGKDDDCDGEVDDLIVATNCIVDADHDGSPSGPDCNDDDASIHPRADDTRCDGVDRDCDGADCMIIANPAPDWDNDGYTFNVDCNDNDANVHPDAPEHCNDGIDNDCDTKIDGLDDTDCIPVNGMLDVDELLEREGVPTDGEQRAEADARSRLT
jgi:hypothetical protein